MNQKELKAMLSAAKKLGWNGKPASEVIIALTTIAKHKQRRATKMRWEMPSFEEVMDDLALTKNTLLSWASSINH